MPPKKRTRKESGLEYECNTLTDEDLRKALLDVGENPGPIDSSNRDIYVRQLVRKKAKSDTTDGAGRSPLTPPLSSGTSTGETQFSTPRAEPSKGKRSTQLTRAPLTASRKLPEKTKLTVSPTLTAKPKVTQTFDVNGLVAAAFTPFNDDGELNLSRIRPYAEFLLKQGVKAVFICGTTGESVSLTVSERKLVVEEWMRVAGGRMTVIVHVGTMSLKSTCDLASHAEECGAAAIGLIPPCYFKPPTIDSLVLYLQKVGESAPNTPMYYYHIPVMTGVTLSMEDLLARASSELPTLRGLKYTDEDLMQFSRCVAYQGGKYPVMYGRDEQVLSSLVMGGYCAVGSTYNYSGQLNNRLFQAYEKGDMTTALREQRRSQDAIQLLKKYGKSVGGVAVGKTIMKIRGFDVGPPRLPLLPLSVEDYTSLVSDLKAIGFFDWA